MNQEPVEIRPVVFLEPGGEYDFRPIIDYSTTEADETPEEETSDPKDSSAAASAASEASLTPSPESESDASQGSPASVVKANMPPRVSESGTPTSSDGQNPGPSEPLAPPPL